MSTNIASLIPLTHCRSRMSLTENGSVDDTTVAGPSKINGNVIQQNIQLPTEQENGSFQKRPYKGIAGGATSSLMIRKRVTHIPAKKPVLLKLANGRLKSVELHPGKTVSLGKFGSFRADDIIGLPYGLTFEISLPVKGKANGGGGRKADEVGELRMVISDNVEELEDNNATNENIQDSIKNNAQTMTYLDIRALKEAGAEGRDIVEQQVANNTTFAQRTSWSQQKFILRKEAKHMRLFTPVPPTMTNVIRFHADKFDRDAADKLRGLRADSLANILSLAGVAPGRRFIVIDGVGGLVVGSMLERMGGEGRLLLINDSDSPPSLDLMTQFDLPTNFVDPVLRTMHWASTQADWQPFLKAFENESLVNAAAAEGSESNSESLELTAIGRPVNDRDRQRMKRKQALASNYERIRDEYFEGQFDGLVIVSKYEPTSIIDKVTPHLAGSANVVVHSPFLQPLIEAHAVLRSYPTLINVSVTEPFQRRYQVLPGRMHPEMMTSATAGYILHGIRVLTEEETEKAGEERGEDEKEGKDDSEEHANKKARTG